MVSNSSGLGTATAPYWLAPKPPTLPRAAAFLWLECVVCVEVMRSGAEGKPFSILFRGFSALIVYEVGVFAALRDVAPDLLTSASNVYGSTSGSIVATIGLCGCNIGKGCALPFIPCLTRLDVWKL